jgi:hypothetical protein
LETHCKDKSVRRVSKPCAIVVTFSFSSISGNTSVHKKRALP